MADPICRWRNSSVKQLLEFNSLFPLKSEQRAQARNIVEGRWKILGGKDFFTTPYQLAAQMGVYYEDETSLIPRFNRMLTIEESLQYMKIWAKSYYAPNPYTPSMNMTVRPIIINNFLVNWYYDHDDPRFSEALRAMFPEDIGNTDILVNMLNNFSDVNIDVNDQLSLKEDAPSERYDIIELEIDKNDKKHFFEHFPTYSSAVISDKLILANRKLSFLPNLPSDFPETYSQYITAIKTKPFVLLAGISGTGKSRIVRQLARACDTLDESPWTVQTPQNFEMIQVRPDWHDSSELLGYESRISGKAEYVVKNFVKFIVKAWLHEDVPFFLCLDEMNLAPVEQYFAEYLSVVESRRLDEQGNIACDPLIKLNRQHCQSIVNEMLAPSESDDTDANQLNQAEEMMILLEGMDYTLPLPQNLIVMGTVNMDETTFSFSRKVLDRAMTIEMNEVDLKGGLIDTEKERFHVNAQDILPNAVEGKDVYATNQPLCDRVIKFLEEVNEVLEGTPFKIAYRTRNEFLLYAVNRGEEHFEEALDEMTSMKILSRIEGDQDKVGDVLDQLKTVLEKNSIPTEGKSLPKITEMNKKLDKGYTSYWS